jgi:uncharacterized metal-binding protein (TIGR02443 family)
MFKAKKRFIAGAVCPRCSEMDKLTMYTEDEKDYRECVGCGFKEQMRLQSAPKELDTRVNKTKEERDAEVQPVKLIDPGESN